MIKKVLLCAAIATSCSPLKTSPHDEKHQWELSLHEVQTNLDDLRHDIHCFQTEFQILEGRIKHFETAIAALKADGDSGKLEQLFTQMQSLEKKWSYLEKTQAKEIESLTSHASETNTALTQFKSRIQELEQELLHAQNPSKGIKIYKVRPGDSLEKIARAHKTAVERIKKCNNLEQDLIVVGQELKIE